MGIKEKLVELLDNFHRDLSPFAGDEKLFVVDDNMEQAEYLIANGVTVQKWISVTERLPEICGYPVLMIAVNKYGQKKIVKGFTNYECPVEFCTNEKEYDLCWHCWEVTHWMPLPELPMEALNNGC